MTLIVEDGTGVSGANSYVSVAGHIAYAALYGKTVTSEQAEINLRSAMDYIELPNYKGTKEFDASINNLKHPRINVVVDGVTLTPEQELAMINKAENEIALSIFNGVDPLGQKPRAVKSETFGPFSRTYMDNTTSTPTSPRVNAFLKPLLLNGGGALHFKVITHTNYGDY